MNKTGLTIFFAFVVIHLMAGMLFAALPTAVPVASPSWNPGSGPQELGLDDGDKEGPARGPTAILAGSEGFIALDAMNHRIISGDRTGKLDPLAVLPQGNYADLSRSEDKSLWVVEKQSRDVYRVEAGEARKAFTIPKKAGLPRQFDFHIWAGKSWVVGDFPTRSLYFFDSSGKLLQTASWPLALSLAEGPDNSVCFLASADGDAYDTLSFIDRSGKLEKAIKLVPGECGGYLGSARLLGFLKDGPAIAFAWKDENPEETILFAIAPNGQTAVLSKIPGPPAFSARCGCLDGNSLWLNATKIGGETVEFRCFDLK